MWKHDKQFKKGHIPHNKGKKDPASSERMKDDNPMKRRAVREKSSTSHAGKVLSEITRLHMSAAQKKVIAEGMHNFYKDGRTKLNQRLRHSVEYKIWRAKVYARDEWTCQTCGNKMSGNLEAHHIKSWAEYPELRFNVENGVTLCKECHELTDSYPIQLKSR